MLGKLLALVVLLAAAAAVIALTIGDAEARRFCPTCGLKEMYVVSSSVGGPTVWRCVKCGAEVTLVDS